MIALCFFGGYIIEVIIGIQMKDELGRPGVGYQQLGRQKLQEWIARLRYLQRGPAFTVVHGVPP